MCLQSTLVAYRDMLQSFACPSRLQSKKETAREKRRSGFGALLNLSQPPSSAISNPVVARCNQIIPQREYTFVLSYLSFFLSSVEYKNQRIPSITPIPFSSPPISSVAIHGRSMHPPQPPSYRISSYAPRRKCFFVQSAYRRSLPRRVLPRSCGQPRCRRQLVYPRHGTQPHGLQIAWHGGGQQDVDRQRAVAGLLSGRRR